MPLNSHSWVLTLAEPTGSLTLQLPQDRNPGVCDPDSSKEPNTGTRLQHPDTASSPRKRDERKSSSGENLSVFSGAFPCWR